MSDQLRAEQQVIAELKASNIALQERLHRENQRRFEQIEANQDAHKKAMDAQSMVLEEIKLNTADLPKLKQDVEDIQNERNRAKGAVKLALALGTGSGVFEIARWFFGKH